MGKRIGWTELSEKQRQRYINGGKRRGIRNVRRYYETGGDLAALRGHANTPERPYIAARQPERYNGYIRRHPNSVRPMTAFVFQQDWDFNPNAYNEVELADHVEWTKEHRTVIAKHWNAVKDWIHTKLASGREREDRFRDLFAPFESVTVGGTDGGIPEYRLETRRPVIDTFVLANEDETYEHIYKEPE